MTMPCQGIPGGVFTVTLKSAPADSERREAIFLFEYGTEVPNHNAQIIYPVKWLLIAWPNWLLRSHSLPLPQISISLFNWASNIKITNLNEQNIWSNYSKSRGHFNCLEFWISVIGICPSARLRVVSMSNHLSFVFWCLRFSTLGLGL